MTKPTTETPAAEQPDAPAQDAAGTEYEALRQGAYDAQRAAADRQNIDLDAGIAHLRSQDSGAMRIWTVKGPKEGGGTISGVLLTEPTRVVLLHQFASGKFTVFEKVA